MFIGALLAAIGGALQAGAVNVAMLIVGRLIAGFAIGLMSATIPIYCVSLLGDRGAFTGLEYPNETA